MGRVIASRLAADGFDVAIAYTGNVDLADATVGEIKEHGRLGAAFGRPDDITGVVSFLAGPTGRWVNGQVVYANGGFA